MLAEGDETFLELPLLRSLYEAGDQIERFSEVVSRALAQASESLTQRLGQPWPTLSGQPAHFQVNPAGDRLSVELLTEGHTQLIGSLTWEPMEGP